METETFEVTYEHLMLLDRMFIGYDEWTEFGAPEVDPKRPYGNSYVYGDIAELIGLEPEGDVDSYGDQDFTTEQLDYMKKLHLGMQHVLQILVDTRSIETGRYEREKYVSKWKKVG